MGWRGTLGLLVALLGTGAACTQESPVEPVASCASGESICGQACIDTATDPRHCGACGNPCAEGEVCAGGSCEAACPGTQTACDGACFDLQTSPGHCGACGFACGAGMACVDGSCTLACGAGRVACDGSCRDTATDREHCGSCGTTCEQDELCVGGSCELACPQGLAACAGACRDTDNDPAHCGACGVACNAGERCSGGSCVITCSGFAATDCNGTCTNVETDPANCGGCGIACADGEVCSDGACTASCTAADDVCAGSCTSLAHDPANCGACGNTCGGAANTAAACLDGACTTACLAGHADCDGVQANGCETVLATAVDSCGTCGNRCEAPANATAACIDGACGIGTCGTGWADCDTNPANGCEAHVAIDEAHCGACGNVCGAGLACVDGACILPPPGESCLVPRGLLPGVHTIPWSATARDHLVSPPACGDNVPPVGPDLTFAYQAMNTGFVQIVIERAVADRWHAIVTQGACEPTGAPLLCSSVWSAEDLELTFRVTAGQSYFVHLVDTDYDTAPLPNPLELTLVEQPDAAAGLGESCANPADLTAGTNTINWSATLNNYMPQYVSCSSTASTGPDVVMRYHATFDGAVDVSVDRQSGPRWHVLATGSVCGDISAPLACVSGTGASLKATLDLTAGNDYFVYLIDSTSGATPLDNPLTVQVTERNCALLAPSVTSLTPANGATLTTLLPQPRVVFSQPVDNRTGTITLTGSLGTTRSFALPSPAVAFSADRRTLSIDAGVFASGETVTVGWTGLVDATCGHPIASTAWTFTMPTAPCSPGLNGMSSGTVTRMPLGAVGTLGEQFIAADADPNGWVYIGGSSTLHRAAKNGGAFQDVGAAAGLTSSHLGTTMVIDGPNIYTVESKTSGTTGHLWRISTDGGATWAVEDAAVFPSVPTDDFGAAAARGGTIHLLTAEGTATIGNQIWSVEPVVGTAVLAKHELTFGANQYVYCHGLAVDQGAWFTICRETATGSPWHVLRIDRTTHAVTELTASYPGNSSTLALHGADSNGDGYFDYLYAQSEDQSGHVVCAPWSTPYFDQLFRFGPETTLNYGMGFDPVSNALWTWDDDSFEWIKVQ